jgi:mono/diheme cytochrome c family protein
MFVRKVMTVTTVAIALSAAGCGGGEDAVPTNEPAAEETPAATATDSGATQASAGREIFVSTCGGCHVLSDAGTNGQVGPNLDEVAPDQAQVLAAIETGPGQMPENLLEGEQAEQVAEYVAEAAGP